MSIDDRILPLLGQSCLDALSHSGVTVFGLGGVGGTAFEALVRSGVSPLLGVDFDIVDESNLNRQILFTRGDIGFKKTVAAKRRAKLIRPSLSVETIDARIDADMLLADSFDNPFWIDAVDDIEAKVALAKAAQAKGIRLFISLGMGNRLSPDKVLAVRLDKTEGDPLGKKLRKRLREEGVDLKRFIAVYSQETPAVKPLKPSSMMPVPSSAGLLLASLVMKEIIDAHR